MSQYLRLLSYPDRTTTQVWNIEDDRATTAQFGIQLAGRCQADWQSFFHTSALPRWELSDVYIYPYNGGEWSPVPFKF